MKDFTLTVPIPKCETDFKLPDPDLIRYYKDYEDRVYYLDYEIDEFAFEIVQRIFEYNRQDAGIKAEERKPITIFINSYGGDVDITMSIISAMLASVTPIITVNCGTAMSCGGFILLAGHKRYAMKYSTVMFHPGSAVQGGTYNQIEESQKNYKRTVDMIANYIVERTNISKRKLYNNWAKDWYLPSSQQLELGIVNKIINNLDEVL